MANPFPHQQGARAYLTRQLNLKLNTAFNDGDLIFGPVESIAGSNDVWITVQATDKDRYSGYSRIRVKRQDIAALLYDIDIQIAAPMVATVHELLPLINAKYHLALDEDDVHDEGFSLGYLGPVTVAMKGSSLMWTGQFTVELIPPPQELDTVVVDGTYTDLVYPASLDTSRQVAEIRFGAVNASDIAATLSNLLIGDVIGADGTTGVFLPATDKRPEWYVDLETPGTHNLAGAVVSYNGANDGVYFTGDHRWAFVCVLELGDMCTKYGGRLVLVYN